MKKLEIQGKMNTSIIYVGETIKKIQNYTPAQTQKIIITDRNVAELYQSVFPSWPVIEIGLGEKIKTLETVQWIYEKLIDLDADRSTFIVAIGGGVVSDIAGFCASTYLRGIRFGFVSSTLLAQVDASVGGKNGVNFRGFKNMVGVFNQPEFVLCDIELLKTLPERELACGFAEIIKHAVIADAKLFSFIESNAAKAMSMVPDVIEKLVYDSVVIKSDVVNRDEREKGERRKLNFGHTFGHAVEKTAGLPHGEAIAVGMKIAAGLSVKKRLLSVGEANRITEILKKFGLPIDAEYDKDTAIDALRKDKKKEGDAIHFVLLKGIGNAVIDRIAIKELAEVLNT